jgi:6-pyruvoyltetrahydropterin/6-carboxytetrahydropterin synthase
MSAVLERRLADELPDNVSEVDVQVSETSELCGGASF